jgi:hypothetical protein
MLTVSFEANQDLATLESVKAALGIADSSEDLTLPPLITQASAGIAKHCNRTFIEEDVDETFRTDGRDCGLLLSRYPISEIAAATENGTALDPADFEADPSAGIINRLYSDRIGCWQRGKVVISYTAGYPIADVPGDIVRALVLLVQQFRSQGSRDPLLRAEETTDIERLEYFVPIDTGLPGSVQALLVDHRKPAGA